VTENNDELLTITEVAKYLKVSKRTVIRLIESSELEVIRVGVQIRIWKSTIIGYLNRHKS